MAGSGRRGSRRDLLRGISNQRFLITERHRDHDRASTDMTVHRPSFTSSRTCPAFCGPITSVSIGVTVGVGDGGATVGVTVGVGDGGATVGVTVGVGDEGAAVGAAVGVAVSVAVGASVEAAVTCVVSS